MLLKQQNQASTGLARANGYKIRPVCDSKEKCPAGLLEWSHEQKNIFQDLLGGDDEPVSIPAGSVGFGGETPQLGGQRGIRHRSRASSHFGGRGARVCPHAKQAEGVGHAPLLQSHCRQPRSISFDESNGQGGGTERGSTNGHDRVRNELREVVPDSREQRLGAAQFGVIAAYFRGGRMLDRYTRLWREERQPVHGGFGAGDRERGGRSGEAFARQRRRDFSRSGGRPRRAGGGDQGDAGPAAQLPDATVRLRKSAVGRIDETF